MDPQHCPKKGFKNCILKVVILICRFGYNVFSAVRDRKSSVLGPMLPASETRSNWYNEKSLQGKWNSPE